ncbi:RagB/SusD family nutrient uptake outer membrane protein [Pedobacter jeongneungensis]|uniref:RagB/SusD family nutrient uptake outer membrane protein n=1 Tax=Pedobacter jeongneungensis TaxID=947309 RepID=UPI000468F0CD|nr:RagB/SusD family nutrient uptake outer membrane protein [Pedobacter jeongneungensis]
MKKIITILTIITAFALSSCQKYTDITPKGKNLLTRANDLEYLLNYSWGYFQNTFKFTNLYVLDNDITCYETKDVPVIITGARKDFNYVMLTFDKAVDRAELSVTDPQYEGMYAIINTRLNIILEQADKVTDDPQKVKMLKAEALILRAYLHYILVNIYAKAYDPLTSSTDGGIVYANKIDFEAISQKNSVADVYRLMLSDVNDAFALNSLPDNPINAMRVGKGFAYAVKAKILLSMRNFSGALEAANSSLQYNKALEDHTVFLRTGTISRNGLGAADNLFFANSLFVDPTYCTLSPERYDSYEAGSIIKFYTNTYSTTNGFSRSKINGTAYWYSFNYEQNSAGMTVSDTYLMKAECQIRLEQLTAAMETLNEIRKLRIHPSQYKPLNDNTKAQAMRSLKNVSRTELLFTWKNFANIKRWNTEEENKENVSRNLNGSVFTLTPDSPLWIFPFPKSATDFNPNLTQNY